MRSYIVKKEETEVGRLRDVIILAIVGCVILFELLRLQEQNNEFKQRTAAAEGKVFRLEQENSSLEKELEFLQMYCSEENPEEGQESFYELSPASKL